MCFVLLSVSATAQQSKPPVKLPVWKISFDLDLGSEGEITVMKENQEQTIMKEVARSLSGASDGESPLICYVNPGYIRVEQRGIGGGITIADKKDTVSFLIDSTSRTATRFPAATPNLQTQMNGDSVVLISSDDFKMELQNDTMTIAGQACRKALFVNPESPSAVITVWYAPGLPRLYWQKYSYLKQIPGCALFIGTVTKGMKVGIKAVKIEKETQTLSFFLPPPGYTVLEGSLY